MWEKIQTRAETWCRSSTGYAFFGAAMLWLALPPCNLWPLAWVAPVWWVMLIRRRELVGKRPYRGIWLAGLAFWLAAYYWLTLPYWATCFGWLALGLYLAFYLPVFVGLSRVAVHQLRIPVIVAAPVVWTGLELTRGHLLTGITMASLGHTQYRWIELIQMSDLFGAYGVSFVVVLVAACAGRMLPCEGKARSLWPIVPAMAVVAAAVLYGHFRVKDPGADKPTAKGEPVVAARIALIQGSIDTEMKSDPDMAARVNQHYDDLTRTALNTYKPLDLIVWPETMYRFGLIEAEPSATKPPGSQESEDDFRRRLRMASEESHTRIATAAAYKTPLILGVDTMCWGSQGAKYFNAAVFVSADGKILGRYDKMHPVMFGEYVPFVRYLPWLQNFVPQDVSLTEGARAAAFELKTGRMSKSLCLSPNICYENVLPHVIRRQVNQLREDGKEPDALVSLTNDGWFWGSAELDMHLICAVFRAVECRKPFLIAANTGFSASIDGDGNILAQGKRRDTDVLLAEVVPDGRHSFYLDTGDWSAGACLAFTVILAVVGMVERQRKVAAALRRR